MDEIKVKFMDFLHMQSHRKSKIPPMGFQSISAADSISGSCKLQENESNEDIISQQKSDQEILESIELIFYKPDSCPRIHQLQKVLKGGVNFDFINETIIQLRTQHKVLSNQVLQNILERKSAYSEEISSMNDIRKELEESLWICRKARSYLNFAKMNLTTTSLEILTSYRKREILKELLHILNAIKQLKSIDGEVHKILMEHNYSGAISLLLHAQSSSQEYMKYACVQSLDKKLQETLLLTDFQLDAVLNDMVLNFDMKKYSQLQEAYKLLNKSLIAMDQMHINFISAIHSSVNAVIRGYIDISNKDNSKFLYEQLCEQVNADRYISCLISLCKIIWTILASHYQIVIWHQNYKLHPLELRDSADVYIEEKLRKGKYRIWNDILTKIYIYLQSSKLKTLKYDQFIQAISVIQRLRKVGIEFCGEHSDKLIEIIQIQSEEFFKRYHISCLEETCLFLDNESWTRVDCFANIFQLPEFRSVRHTIRRRKSPPAILVSRSPDSCSPTNNNCNELMSIHSQDAGSSVYDSSGYFIRFFEKGSPFDGGFDAAMLEEDILSGIIDEGSCYYSEESDEDQKSLQNKYEDDNRGNIQIIVNSTTLNIFRCIGRYLQMCKLLHCISPKIVASMMELLDFYAFTIHEVFGKDASIHLNNLHTAKIESKFKKMESDVIRNLKIWPLNFSSLINNELANPDTLYGLSQRIVAIESGRCMIQQFQLLYNYLFHLLPIHERQLLVDYFDYIDFMADVSRPIYACVTSRIIDWQVILGMMSKVKWDVNHVSFQHNNYVDIMNRSVQNLAMRLEDITKEMNIPIGEIWNSMAHVATYLLVQGYSNVKKCSAGGRALMQLDFTNFMSVLELLSDRKFPENRLYVDGFIKAYYYSNKQFEDWISSQKELEQYSTKQLINLIQCVCASDKRAKQKLLHLMDSNNTNINSYNLNFSGPSHS